MSPTFLLLRYRLLTLRRFLVRQAFPIFVLGPLVVGGALWVVDRYLPLVRAPLADLLAADAADAVPGSLGLVLALFLTALHLPAALTSIFPVRSPDTWLDILPTPEGARFDLALGVGLARQVPAAGVVLLALLALAEGEISAALLARLAGYVLATVAILAPLALLAATARVRWGMPRGGDRRSLVVLCLVLAAVLAIPPALRPWLLLPFWPAAAQLEAALGTVLGAAAPISAIAAGWPVLALTLAALYPIARLFVARFRRRDLERAAGLVTRRQAVLGRRFGALGARFAGRPTGELLVRDLRYVLRRFSPAVLLAAGLSVVLLAAVLLVLPGLALPLLGLRRLAVLGILAAVLALASLVPFVLKDQLSRFWLEKSTPVPPEALLRSKLWLARLLALPAALVGAAIFLTLGLAGRDLAAALLQLIAGTWIIASTIGLAVFEIAAQPILGLVFSAFVALALASLFVVYPQAWWLWIVFYVVVASKLAERAERRIHFTEVET